MSRMNWEKELPEVPECVHRAVMGALGEIGENPAYRQRAAGKRRRYKGRTILIAAAAMTAVLGTTVLAAELFSWNERAKEQFGGSKEVQDKLVEEQFAIDEYESVTDNGLTVTAIQTVQDENYFYALFEISSEDKDIVLDENSDMEYTIDWGSDENPFAYMGSGFARKGESQGNRGYFEIYGNKADTSKAEDISMNLHFTALQKQGEKAGAGTDIIRGKWDLSVTVHQTPGESFAVDQKAVIAGYDMRVKEVRLSPLTVTVVYDGEDIRAMESGEGLNLAQLDILPITIIGLRYQDGTVIKEDGFTTEEGYREDGNYFITTKLSDVAEAEKVEAILFGEENAEVKIR